MKLIKVITALVLITLTFTSCKSKSPKELIVNKWKVTEVNGGKDAQVPDSIKKVMIDNGYIEFTKEGKYILTGIPASALTGNYSISDDGKSLTTTPDGREAEVSTINELSESKLTITDDKTGARLALTAK